MQWIFDGKSLPSEAVSWTPAKKIDFSSKHGILIENDDGSLTPMDVPYFKAALIAPGTWQILLDGDFSYLVEGDDESIVIDTGYGAGNIRDYCQSLTQKPVRSVINTHCHFDHTANDAYFDCAYMSADTSPLATIPFPSFEGISFPRDYPAMIVGDSDKMQLGNRDLEVFEIPNHCTGGIALLDRRERILFSGDEIMRPDIVMLNCPVSQFQRNMSKLFSHRSGFDRLCGGAAILNACAVDHFLSAANFILSGRGTPEKWSQDAPPVPKSLVPASGRKVYARQKPRPEDLGDMLAKAANVNLVQITYAGCTIVYDRRYIY